MEEVKYRKFEETYKIITFALCSSFTYPNPTMKYLCGAGLVVVSMTPWVVLILLDMYRCWAENDLINAIRHSTVIGPFLGGFFKIIMMYRKHTQGKQIIEEISRDYLLFNNFSKRYRDIATAGIRNSQVYSEKWWACTVTTCVFTFPVMAIVLNTYSYLVAPEPVKYMIHDFRLPGENPEIRFESPYFELIFAYTIYASVLYVLNFTGYDSFFGVAINHACLKMELYCAALEDAMKADSGEVYGRVVGVIKQQCKMYKFVNFIQDTFNLWLGIIFIATMIQICCCMYHITEGLEFDLRYMIFIVGAVLHIYLPCRYAAKLKAMSLETATRIYCCGWEHVDQQSVRRLIVFMIARAQIPIEITAFSMLTFDMELFLSIMQTSYSMYTLLRK